MLWLVFEVSVDLGVDFVKSLDVAFRRFKTKNILFLDDGFLTFLERADSEVANVFVHLHAVHVLV